MTIASAYTRNNKAVVTYSGPNWFIDNFMSQVPVGTITPDLIKSVALHQLKNPANSDHRKIEIGEAVYSLCDNMTTEANVMVFAHTWEALKRVGTICQKDRFRRAINAANKDMGCVKMVR